MRALYRNALKRVLHDEIIKTRDAMGLTQSQMAELLMMDVRSYVEIDHGNSTFGTLSLVLFLLHCCNDPMALLRRISFALEEAGQHVA